jgi:hypothetical protein
MVSGVAVRLGKESCQRCFVKLKQLFRKGKGFTGLFYSFSVSAAVELLTVSALLQA